MEDYRLNLVEEAMDTAKLMGGASWPSADMTRWALERLANHIADRILAMYERKQGGKELRDEILLSCGLLKPDTRS